MRVGDGVGVDVGDGVAVGWRVAVGAGVAVGVDVGAAVGVRVGVGMTESGEIPPAAVGKTDGGGAAAQPASDKTSAIANPSHKFFIVGSSPRK